MGNAHVETGAMLPTLQQKQGYLQKESVTMKQWRNRYFVLSNRRLSYYNTRDDYDRRDLKAAIDLEGCTLKLYSADDYELHLITPKNKTRRDAQDGQFEFHLRAPTPYELQEWLRKLRIAMRPVWVDDARSSKCAVCKAGLGLGNRKHHCRNCGKIVCGNCSPETRALPDLDYSAAVRVCRGCFADPKKQTTAAATAAFEASATLRRREFDKRKAQERAANKARHEEFRARYARDATKK